MNKDLEEKVEESDELFTLEEVRSRPSPSLWKRFWIKIRGWCEEIKLTPRKIKWSVQRMRRGWSERDVWNFHYHLSDIIAGGLRELRGKQHGSPVFYERDEQGNIEMDNDDRPIEKGWEKAKAQWNEELDKMIRAFEMAGEEDWTHFPVGEWDKEVFEDYKEIDEEYESEDYHPHTMTKEEQEQMEKGMELFIKRFFSLWD